MKTFIGNILFVCILGAMVTTANGAAPGEPRQHLRPRRHSSVRTVPRPAP